MTPHLNLEELKKLGGKIHEILNEAILRKLTHKEYMKLVRLIDKVFKLTQ